MRCGECDEGGVRAVVGGATFVGVKDGVGGEFGGGMRVGGDGGD